VTETDYIGNHSIHSPLSAARFAPKIGFDRRRVKKKSPRLRGANDEPDQIPLSTTVGAAALTLRGLSPDVFAAFAPRRCQEYKAA